jgi:signal transduction histidine kinase
LSAILASAQLLLRDTHAAPRSLRSAQRIARSAGRMMRMIEALLDFTRIRTGSGIPVERGRADLVAITRQVLEELRLANPERDVLFEVRGDGRGAWDADRLAQVVSNLLGNALTHGADSGPVRIVLDATGDPVDLVVQNQGVIPAEALPALFEPFRRAASPHGARALSGLGLGLYISREIVIAHGGVIAVSSADGGGTTFRVSLPRGGETTGALSG